MHPVPYIGDEDDFQSRHLDGFKLGQIQRCLEGGTANASNKVGSGGVDAMMLLVDIGSMMAFDPKGDLNGISQRWKRWKRSFASYLTGKGVTDDKQKRALLLHAAGVDVQIYFTMVSEEEIFSFTTTMKALDDYFVPKSTVPFERHCFKQIAQASDDRDSGPICV